MFLTDALLVPLSQVFQARIHLYAKFGFLFGVFFLFLLIFQIYKQYAGFS